MRRLLPLLLLSTGCARSVPPKVAAEATAWGLPGELLIEDLPLWTNKYAATRADAGLFFRISALMEAHGLRRDQAVEVQNQVRDALRETPDADPSRVFARALEAVRAGASEAGLDREALDAARFVVVFDLDETLYDQYWHDASAAEACADVAYDGPDGRRRNLLRAPAWTTVFDTIRQAGGAIAVFSANVDELTMSNMAQWTWEGVPLTEHPDIEGILTNSYLVMQDKAEPPKPAPVAEPSKDLRIFDPTLDKVILVDDNPTRVFQFGNLRATRKFHADAFCDPDTPAAFRDALGGELAVVAREIRDAVDWLDAHPDATFAHAYLPYSHTGRLAVDALVHSAGLPREDAIAYVRDHPETADGRF